jgi:hypothetical protein
MNGGRGLVLPLLLGAATLTLAGLLWVSLASRLFETGLRINDLVTTRQSLLEQRAAARLHHATATDPRRLFDRARELGFGPDGAGPAISVAIPAIDVGLGAAPPGSSALSLSVHPPAAPRADVDSPWPSLSLIGTPVQDQP